MRIVLFGTSAFAVPSLQVLVKRGHTIVQCVTQPDRPQGRGLKPQASPVKQAAQALRLPLTEPTDLRTTQQELRALNPDVGVVIAYGRLVPSDLLQLPTQGMVGLHPSLLPKYRGASPIVWALLNGDSRTGVTVFRLNERMDAGDILTQQPVSIGPQETAEVLSVRLAAMGAGLLADSLQALEQGTASFQPQNDAAATYTTKLTKAHGLVDWTASAAAIDRMVRALNPWPGVTTSLHGRSLRVWSTALASQPVLASAHPGTVIQLEDAGAVVATGQGALVIQDVQPAGRRRMSVREFLAGHVLRVGDQFDHA